MDGYPTAPHRRHTPRTEAGRERQERVHERRSARRLAAARARGPTSSHRRNACFWSVLRVARGAEAWTSVGGNVQVGLRCGGKWGRTPIPDRGGGAPPTPPPRPELPSRDMAHPLARRTWPSAAPSTTASTRRTGSRSRPSSGLRCRRASSLPRASSAACRSGRRSGFEAYTGSALQGVHPLSDRRAQAHALLQRQLARHRPRRRRARDGPRLPARARRAAQGGRRHRRRRLPRGLGPRRLDATTTPRSPTSSPTSPPPSAMLVDMTTTHVPVLAGELDRPPRPAAGRDRGRLHVRRRRPRAAGRRSPGPRRRAHRHRPRPRGRGALRRARGRRGRAARASSARRSPRRSRSCATRASAPTSSTSTSACPRCRSTRASAASPTPTTRRWTCAWTPTRS